MAMRRCVATRCLWSRCTNTLESFSHHPPCSAFALCVSWCQSEHLPVTLASSIFMTYVLPSVAWGSEFLSGSPSALRVSHMFLLAGGGDVVGVVTPLVGGVAQAFHDDQVVELRVQLGVQEVEGKEEDREGQVEVEEEKRLKEVRSWMTMEMFMTRLRS